MSQLFCLYDWFLNKQPIPRVTTVMFSSAAALWLLCHLAQAQQQPASESPTPVKSTNQILIDGAILKTVEVTSVAAQVQGLLNSVWVREGDRVKAQAPLASIQSTTTELQLNRAKAWKQTYNQKNDR